jgi:hypothetical protein
MRKNFGFTVLITEIALPNHALDNSICSGVVAFGVLLNTCLATLKYVHGGDARITS